MESVTPVMGAEKSPSFHQTKDMAGSGNRSIMAVYFFQTGTGAHWGFFLGSCFVFVLLQLLRMRMLCLTRVSEQRRFTSRAGPVLLPGEE